MTVSGEEKEREERGCLFSLLDSERRFDPWAAPSGSGPLSTGPYLLCACAGIDSMWTYLRPSLPSRNATRPSQRANKVWSLPRPTLSPGYHLVPRWRTMMFPARTASLPNFLTPRRLDCESRPLREEPPAFLCAIVQNSTF